MKEHNVRQRPAEAGISVVEMLIVACVLVIISAIALPQIISARRVHRFKALAHEITSELRRTRQLAMSQRQVFRFRYDDANKRIVIIDNQGRGTAANPLANDPNDDRVVSTVSLAGAGVPAGDIVYGRPGGAPASLPDGTALTAPAGSLVEIVFQPDGSVLDANGNPASAALFLYNRQEPADSAIAVSVLGAGGRVKSWRYSRNVNRYVN